MVWRNNKYVRLIMDYIQKITIRCKELPLRPWPLALTTSTLTSSIKHKSMIHITYSIIKSMSWWRRNPTKPTVKPIKPIINHLSQSRRAGWRLSQFCNQHKRNHILYFILHSVDSTGYIMWNFVTDKKHS